MPTEATKEQPPFLDDIDAKIAFLRQPDSYQEPIDRVDTVETHTSWLFLVGSRVYKLKKPLRYDYLDFSTLEARRRNCQAEIRLNRRLTPDIYLASVPLTATADRHMTLGGAGQPIDWLVKMRRLPADQEFEYRLQHGTVGERDIVDVARLLADFYEKTAPVPISEFAYLKRFDDDIQANFETLAVPEFGLPRDWLDKIVFAQRSFLDEKAVLLGERVQNGRIIEAHGDLRPEHIYLGPQGPKIIDCLEFNREFRILDSVDELAFLAMECERLAAPFVGDILFRTYQQATSDDPPAGLVHFYMSYRALLWAKLAILHIRRHGAEQQTKWEEKTRRYLRLADEHISRAV